MSALARGLVFEEAPGRHVRNIALIGEGAAASPGQMAHATAEAENRRAVLRWLLDAVNTRRYRAFVATDLFGVQAATGILTCAMVHIVGTPPATS